MNTKLERAIREAENNIYSGVNFSNGAIVFLWTLLCLFLINKADGFLYTAFLGGAFYFSLLVLCLLLFKGIRKYLRFPKENKKMPVFIGHKLDTIFTYPVLIMSLIGIIENLLSSAGIFSTDLEQLYAAGGASAWEFMIRSILVPLTALAEELLNLLLVSFFYKYMKVHKNFRLIGSIFTAALIFGILHTFGWGLEAVVPIGIAYIPVFIATLYTGNIWISFLAHLYNDLISFTKYYYGGFHFIIIAVISLIPVTWAIGSMFRKTR